MPGVAEGETPDGETVRVEALKNAKGVNFLRPVFALPGWRGVSEEYVMTLSTWGRL